jgi:hypothetical protein
MPAAASQFCAKLYLGVEDIDRSRTKTKSPQTDGTCELFHKIVLNEFYMSRSANRCTVRSTSRRPIWIPGSKKYNEAASSGTLVFRQNPMQTFLDAMPMAKEK